MKQIVKVKLKRKCDDSYFVLIGSGIIKKLPVLIKSITKTDRAVVITDAVVKKLWGKRITAYLQKTRSKIDLLTFPAGEKSKNQNTVAVLQNKMLRIGCNRNTLMIALGGGVVGDVAGFAAATFMRGIPYIQAPTTMLAMVDSSIGGKTGINTKYGKNLIGAFWQPLIVVIDLNFLKTLPKQHLQNGLVEAVKIFLTSDGRMFKMVEDKVEKILDGDLNLLQKIIIRSVRLKSDIVERDEKESGERMILNFGHTIGHAIEVLSDYRLLHGQAVALGIVAEARMAASLGLLKQDRAERIENLIKKLGINLSILKKFKVNKIIKSMQFDKKGKNKFILLNDIGTVYEKGGNYAFVVDDKIIKKILK